MQIVINIDNNLYTRLFDNGETDAADMLKACTAIRKGDVLSQGHGLKIMAKLPPIEEMAKKVAEEALDGYIYMGKTLREWIDAVKQTRWIPVNERLPEESGEYLVRPSDGVLEDYSDFSEVMIMPYDADRGAFGWWTDKYDPVSLGYLDSVFNEFEVLAWMSLPEPYKAESEETNEIHSNI